MCYFISISYLNLQFPQKYSILLPLKLIVQLRVENSEFELWQKSDDPCSFFPSNSGRKVYCFVVPTPNLNPKSLRIGMLQSGLIDLNSTTKSHQHNKEPLFAVRYVYFYTNYLYIGKLFFTLSGLLRQRNIRFYYQPSYRAI